MSKLVSIVMYHYVRELKHSRFPEIKGLSIEEFKNQIRYIKKHYNIISADDIMDAVDLGSDLPPRALLLTFDDGYLDHFTQVFPVLDQEKLPGCFFPTAKCILENRVLDVNKIHFILASVEDKGKIVENISQTIDRHRSSYSLETTEKYWQKFGKHNRFDLSEVVFIKRMLQRELPEKLRKKIIGELFNQYVTKDEIGFSKELYMSLDQLACIQRNGMYVGSHSFDHDRLNSLSKNEQKREIDLSLKLLKEVGCNTDRWMMCYPHGAFDDSLLSILKKRNCVIGLKSQFGIADLDRDHSLTLPRLDTNDLPKEADAFFR